MIKNNNMCPARFSSYTFGKADAQKIANERRASDFLRFLEEIKSICRSSKGR
jgi:hypothetical protein